MIALPEGFDSIFRYIIVVSQRAEQLIQGARPRMESRHVKPTLIARDEVDAGLVTWRVLTLEELEAQRQAMVEQLRAEMGAEPEGVPERPLPDVLPTGPVDEPAPAPVAAAAEEGGEGDEELARLRRLLGLGLTGSGDAGDPGEDPAEAGAEADSGDAAGGEAAGDDPPDEDGTE